MSKSMLLRLAIPVALLCSASALRAQTVTTWTDSFTGAMNQRTTDLTGNVDSFEWYEIGTSGAYSYGSAATAGLMVTSTADRGVLGYFTSPGQSAQLLNVGDSIKLTVNFYLNAAGTNQSGSDRLRFALLQSVANPLATTSSSAYFSANIVGGSNTEARIHGSTSGGSPSSTTAGISFDSKYTGFMTTVGPLRSNAGSVAANSIKLYQRDTVASGLLGDGNASSGWGAYHSVGLGGTGYTVPSGGWASSSQLLTAEMTYSLVATQDSSNYINYSFSLVSGSTTYESYSASNILTSTPLSFDTVALYNRTPLINMTDMTITLTSAASAVPEPSTYALIAGAACLGLVVLRRRSLRKAA